MKTRFLRTTVSIALLCLGVASNTLFAAGQKNGDFVVGVSNGYIGNSWRTQMIDSIEKLGEFYKGKGLIKEIIVQNAGLDTNNQIAQIRNMINGGVDILLVDPNSETALNPVMEEAVKKGITVVSIDQPVTSTDVLSVSIDQELWGATLTEWLVKRLGGKGNIVKIEGIAGHPANVGRQRGVEKVLAKNPGIKLLSSVNGNWVQASSQQAMSGLIAAYPAIDGVLSQDGMALGVINAFEAAGKPLPVVTGETQVAFLHKWAELKKAGGFTTFAQNNPPGIGATGLGIAVRLAQGKVLKDNIVKKTSVYPRVYFYEVKDKIDDAGFDAYYLKNKDKTPNYFPDEYLSEQELDAIFK